jgi:hypothetical protein
MDINNNDIYFNKNFNIHSHKTQTKRVERKMAEKLLKRFFVFIDDFTFFSVPFVTHFFFYLFTLLIRE